MTKLLEAAREYLDRKERKKHPKGNFDKKGRWFPAEVEIRPCCQKIRGPSRAFPYSYMTHCRSLGHVAALFDLSEEQLRQAVYVLKNYQGEDAQQLVNALLVPARCGVVLPTTQIKKMAEKLKQEAL